MRRKNTEAHFLPRNSPMLVFEHEAENRGFRCVAGIDEAGRGCCAGPVVAAAVIFTDPARIPAGVNDSKKLSPERRMELRRLLLNDPSVHWAIGKITAEEIDRINILRAAWKAMGIALDALPEADYALVDGNRVRGLSRPANFIVKGDSLSASIAAASILAKTTRDLLMLEAAKQYPAYEFERHKGYCTALHLEKLKQFGPCPIHRRSFEPVRSILNPPDIIQEDLF